MTTDMQISISKNLEERGSSLPSYLSSTIQGLLPQFRPNPSPICETCPQSIWFKTDPLSGTPSEVKCICRDMSARDWKTKAAPVMVCDGREQALMRIQASNEKTAMRELKQEQWAIEKAERARARMEAKAEKVREKAQRDKARVEAKTQKEAEKLQKAADRKAKEPEETTS